MVLGWMAQAEGVRRGSQEPNNMGPYLFIDGCRLPMSSQNAAITTACCSSLYASVAGIVFETKANSKSTMIVHPQEVQGPNLQDALAGTRARLAQASREPRAAENRSRPPEARAANRKRCPRTRGSAQFLFVLIRREDGRAKHMSIASELGRQL